METSSQLRPTMASRSRRKWVSSPQEMRGCESRMRRSSVVPERGEPMTKMGAGASSRAAQAHPGCGPLGVPEALSVTDTCSLLVRCALPASLAMARGTIRARSAHAARHVHQRRREEGCCPCPIHPPWRRPSSSGPMAGAPGSARTTPTTTCAAVRRASPSGSSSRGRPRRVSSSATTDASPASTSRWRRRRCCWRTTSGCSSPSRPSPRR